MTTVQQFANEDEALDARLSEAARRVMDLFGGDETANPEYAEGFEHGFMMAYGSIGNIPAGCCVVTFGYENFNLPYIDGFRAGVEHLGCAWIGDPVE